MALRPVDVVRKVAPNARASYLEAFERGDSLFAQHGVNTPDRLAHFLAQCLHETGGLTIEWESGAYRASRLVEIFGVGHHSARVTEAEAHALAYNGPAIFERVYGLGNPSKARELGNAQPGDGYRYRGGGIMQTTGRSNYRRMGQKCGVDFETNPELVVSAEHALKPALAEWTEGGLNAAADRDDILTITKRINGGTNGLADRRAWLAKVRAVMAQPADGPSAGLQYGDRGYEVEALQRRLAALNYPVGRADGDFGATTRAQLLAFQADRGLPTTGIADAATREALKTDGARPVAESRETATVADLRAEGSTTVKSADAIKAGGIGTGVVAVAKGADEVGTLDAVRGVTDSVSAFRPVIDMAQDAIRWMGSHWWIGALVVAGFALYYSRGIIAARLADHRAGRNMGR